MVFVLLPDYSFQARISGGEGVSGNARQNEE